MILIGSHNFQSWSACAFVVEALCKHQCVLLSSLRLGALMSREPPKTRDICDSVAHPEALHCFRQLQAAQGLSVCFFAAHFPGFETLSGHECPLRFEAQEGDSANVRSSTYHLQKNAFGAFVHVSPTRTILLFLRGWVHFAHFAGMSCEAPPVAICLRPPPPANHPRIPYALTRCCFVWRNKWGN